MQIPNGYLSLVKNWDKLFEIEVIKKTIVFP